MIGVGVVIGGNVPETTLPGNDFAEADAHAKQHRADELRPVPHLRGVSSLGLIKRFLV
jgi:hypothetical protein